MNKINNDHSLHGNIPFSWENRPGVRKENLAGELSKERWTTEVHDNVNLSVVVKEGKSKPSLPPPPCENSNKVISNSNDIAGLPLPPCVFQPHLRSSSRRSKDDDPFLLAYKECTKSNKKSSSSSMRRNSFRGSCKYSCSVRDDSIVRVSHIPMSNSDGKRFQGVKHQG